VKLILTFSLICVLSHNTPIILYLITENLNLKNLYIFVTFLALSFRADCQSLNPNIDFELGNYSIWEYCTGSCCPITTGAPAPPVATRHTLTSGPGVDPYGLFPVVSPAGGLYSLRLGNSNIGSEAEKARYYIHVPTGVTDYSVIYRFAVVFQDPGHPPSQQPRFEVHAYDSVTNNAIPCAQFTYVADSTLPGFHRSVLDTTVFFKEWSNGNINLSAYGGSTIIIDFASADCGWGAHFGYGYLDMTSGIAASIYTVCDTDSVSLNGPGGFWRYAWYDSTTGALIDTFRVLRLPNPTSPQTYKVIMLPYPGYGCPDTLYRHIIPAHLVVQPGFDTLICSATGITLNVVATDIALPLTYTWSPPIGLSCLTCSTTNAHPPGHTRYTVLVADASGCIKTDTFDISFRTTLIQANDTMICGGDPATLHVSVRTAAPPLTWLWSPSGSLSCNNCPNPVATPPGTTTYMVAVTDSSGCTLYDTIKVSRDNIAIVPGPDATVCQSVAATLSAAATGGIYPFIYSWTPGTGLSCVYCSTPDASPSATTVYIATITDSIGCHVKDTMNVFVDFVTINPINSIGVCPGGSQVINPTVSANAAPLQYTWSPADGLSCTTCTNPVATPLSTTDYILTVTDTNGCSQQAKVNVFVDNISVDHIPDTTICHGFPVTFYPNAKTNGSGLLYAWSPPYGLSCDDCANPVASPNKTTSYTLVVTDGNGCLATDSVTVKVAPCDIFLPNAFTPNGDGKNDIFKVVGHLGYFRDYSMSLFNRWGERVYYTEDINAGWDGIYNGARADLGTYFYMVIYSLYGERHMMKGDFELVR
jgi:gliding motility-associated-like protein